MKHPTFWAQDDAKRGLLEPELFFKILFLNDEKSLLEKCARKRQMHCFFARKLPARLRLGLGMVRRVLSCVPNLMDKESPLNRPQKGKL